MAINRFTITSVVCLIFFKTLSVAYAQPNVKDAVEAQTGLVKVIHERFIIDLKYNSTDNFLKRNVYAAFNLDACYVHPQVHEKLLNVLPLLESKKQKLVFFDCFRPLSVQREMWKIKPDSRYVANPKNGSLHNRGIAIDIALANDDGSYLPFPTAFDSFEAKAAQGYKCSTEENDLCDNRDLLRQTMLDIGLSTINSEWWHYQLANPKKYPLIDFKP